MEVSVDNGILQLSLGPVGKKNVGPTAQSVISMTAQFGWRELLEGNES
jgi:hypothetical protein